MKTRRVTIDPDAKEDLRQLYRWIVLNGSPRNAERYIRRIQAFTKTLDVAAERGTDLSHIDPGLRAVPFESVMLAVRVTDTHAIVARVFHHSQDWLKALADMAQATRKNR